MTATEVIDDEAPKKAGKLGMIIGVLLALIAAGGGYFATVSGALPIGDTAEKATGEEEADDLAPIATTQFVPLEPLVVTIRSSSQYKLLRFTGQLEVKPDYVAEIEQLKPRIVDVMNTYLNALEARHFEDPVAMLKLRAQLLRRIQIVTGTSRVEDLLIMEFILQ